MATTASTNAKIARFVRNTELHDQVINGGETTVVQTDGGLVPSLAKVMKDLGEQSASVSDEFLEGLQVTVNERADTRLDAMDARINADANAALLALNVVVNQAADGVLANAVAAVDAAGVALAAANGATAGASEALTQAAAAAGTAVAAAGNAGTAATTATAQAAVAVAAAEVFDEVQANFVDVAAGVENAQTGFLGFIASLASSASSSLGAGLVYYDEARNYVAGTLGKAVKDVKASSVQVGALAGSAAPGLIGFLAAATGAVSRVLAAKLDEIRRSPLDFGAIGDGVADDVVALEKAITAGVPLDWLDKTYRVSRQIGSGSVTLARIDWISRGAKVVLDSTAVHQQAVLYYRIAGGVDHVLKGEGLTFNGQQKANIGIWLYQGTNTRTGTLYAEGLGGINCRRSTAFTSGDGVHIRGGFRKVSLIRPVARDIVLPAGAGTSGVVGVGGIRVTRGSAGESFPVYTYIEDPTVENVSSEDAAYSMDQDGIAIFGDSDSALRTYCSFDIVRGTFTNCWGRAVKSQCSYGTVTTPKLRYTTGPTGGTTNPCIDFQNGPGLATGLDVFTDGVTLASLVAQQTPIYGDWADGVFRDSHAVATNGAIITAIITGFPRQGTYGALNIANVTVAGTVEYIARVYTPDNKTVVNADNVSVTNLTGGLAWVGASGGAAPFLATVRARYCSNRGSLVPLAVGRIAGVVASIEIDQVGCTGFNEANLRNAGNDGSKSGLQKIGALVGEGVTSGTMRMRSIAIASGEEYEFPVHGYENGVCIALVSMSFSNTTQAIVSLSNAGCISLVKGAGVEVGATAEPATGTLRIWKGTAGMRIKNTNASARAVTVLFFG